MRQLKIRCEDGSAQRNGVARPQQAIHLQRFEDVTHRRGAALDRIEIELAGRNRISADGPHQVLVNNALVVYEHSIWNRIVIANDGIDELVDKSIRFKSEFLYSKCHHR